MRRSKGEGSVYQRKDGLWVGQYKVQTINGVKRKYLYGKTKAEARQKLTEALADRDRGLVYDSGNLSLGEYLDRWLKAIENTIRLGTWKQYEMVVRLHIKPAIGRTRLDKLNALQIQTLYREKLDSGISTRRVRYVHVTLSKSLKQAVRWQLIPRNIMEAVEPPRTVRKDIRTLDEEQVRVLLRAAQGNRLEALYVLAVTTGMRQGELLGLRWDDIDLTTATLRVNRTVFNGAINPPKTPKSRRSIRLTDGAVLALRSHRDRQDTESGWVFCTRSGKTINSTNLNKQCWKPLLERAGLPHTRFHDLRHTCATLLLTKGVHPKIVQELLGHSSISITLDTYSHVLPNMQEKAAMAMEDIFG